MYLQERYNNDRESTLHLRMIEGRVIIPPGNVANAFKDCKKEFTMLMELQQMQY